MQAHSRLAIELQYLTSAHTLSPMHIVTSFYSFKTPTFLQKHFSFSLLSFSLHNEVKKKLTAEKRLVTLGLSFHEIIPLLR